MTTTVLPNKSINEPGLTDSGWGTTLNTSLVNIDSAFGGYTVINPTGVSGSVTLTSTQYIPPLLYIAASQTSSATLTANVTYKIPSGTGGAWTVFNNTTGNYTVSFATTHASTNTIQIPQGFTVQITSDGTYVGFSTTAATSFNATIGQIFYAATTATSSIPSLMSGASKLTYDSASQALRFYGATSGYSGVKAATTTTSVTYTLPSADGTSGQLLSTNGSGTLSWTSGSGVLTYPGSGIPVSTGSAWGTSKIAPTGDLVGTSDTQTLSNKTLDANNSISDNGTVSASSPGFRGIPQLVKSSTYTLALSDAGKHISISTGGVNIPSNGSVTFPIGTTIVIYNDSTSSQTISITTDILRQAGTNAIGNRTLINYGLATILKVSNNVWVISGAGVT